MAAFIRRWWRSPDNKLLGGVSGAGNGNLSVVGFIFLSLSIPSCRVSDAAHLTLLTAWGIADALRNNHIPVSLKWPNDLTLSGKKLGGIKTETRIQENLIQQAVIGVGINWQNPVPDVGINLMSWSQETDYWPLQSLEELSAIAISGLLKGYERYQNEGIRSILSDYLSLLQNVGQQVRIEGNLGTIVGVTALGELQVRFRSTGSSTEVALPPGSIRLGYGQEQVRGESK